MRRKKRVDIFNFYLLSLAILLTLFFSLFILSDSLNTSNNPTGFSVFSDIYDTITGKSSPSFGPNENDISIQAGNNWYVSKSVVTSGDGSSWANAWKDTSNIAWSSVQPGDTIWIDGGSSDGQYTYSSFTTGTSGNSTNPITIKKSMESGRDGQAKIGCNININTAYITLDGSEWEGFLLDCTNSQVGINTNAGGNNFHMDYTKIKGYADQVGDDYYSIWARADNLNITNSVFDKPTSQDVFLFSGKGYYYLEGNLFINIKGNNGIHRDVLNAWGESSGYNLIVRRNMFINTGDVFLLQNGGRLGNVWIEYNIFDGTSYILNLDDEGAGANNVRVVNNVFQNHAWDSAYAMAGYSGSTTITNNLDRKGSTGNFNNQYTPTSLSFRNTASPLGVDGKPFTDDDGFTITSSSSFAINAGTNVGITKDILGNPIVGNPDLGAYEYFAPAVCTNCRYVRQGATGNGNGTDWINAYTSLSAAGTLLRNYTYYIADGTYSGYTFDDAASGTQYITIQKATINNHGTDTGWDNSFGDGQAVFGTMTHSVPNGGGYININGSSPSVPYGFKIDFGHGGTGFKFVRGGSYTKLSYIDFDGITDTGTFAYSAQTSCIRVEPRNDNPSGVSPSHDSTTNISISNIACHGGETLMQDTSYNSNILVEYSDFYDCRSSTSSYHANIFFADGQRGTFRYNKVHNHNAEGLYIPYGNTGWKIYGNVFYDGVESGRGIELRQDTSFSNMLIYQNSFYDLPSGAILILSPCTNCEVRNNLANDDTTNGRDGPGSGTQFSLGSQAVSSNNLRFSSSKFVSVSLDNYRLTSATPSGNILSAPYNIDPDGVTRGIDGTWDVGAYEYSSGGGVTPVNGACGSAMKTYSNGETFPTGSLCLTGQSIPSSPTLANTNGATISWICAGQNGGSNSSSCIANRNTLCSSTSASWQSTSFTTQTGTFTATFNVTPSVTGDAVYGLSSGIATDYTSLAAIIRFNDSGRIDVRNGGAYTATNSIVYSVGTTYKIRMVVNISAKTYSVYVTSGSGGETLIANNFAFRTEQNTVSSLSYLGFIGAVGSASLCSLSVGQSISVNYHPADLNTDYAISLNEFTNYSSYFKLSKSWPIAPSPPDANYYSRAYFILKRGIGVQGGYFYNASASCPSCYAVGSVSADTTAPSVISSSPSGTVTSSSTTLSVNTNEVANCRYSTTSSQSFSSMTLFSSSASTTHTQSLTGLSNGNYNYYIKCQDTTGNTMASDFIISFSVSISPVVECPALTGDSCWYVDGTLTTGTNNGSSWTNAYRSFSAINWALVGDGDYIYISGGSSAKNYSQALTVGASGSASKPITITVGQDIGHNGLVTIDLNGGQNIITLSGRNYVTIEGMVYGVDKMVLTDAFTGVFASSSNGIKIRNINLTYLNRPIDFASSTNLLIQGNGITQVRGQSGEDGTALDLAQSCASGIYNNVIVDNNYIEIASDGYGPDGVKPCTGQTYSNNIFRSKSAESFVVTTTEHSDIFQGNGGSYIKIFNNEFINVPEAVINFGGWNLANPTGPVGNINDIYIFNNIFRIDTELDQLPEYFRIYANPGIIPSINNVKFLNNIFVDNNPTTWAYEGCAYSTPGQYCPIRIDRFNTNPTGSGNEFKNNIFYNMGSSTNSQGVIISIDSSTNFNSNSFNFSNNAYYHPGNNLYVRINGVTYNKTQLAVQEPSASMIQPQFISYVAYGANNNFRLAVGDTGARDKGTNLNSYCSSTATTELCFDKDGTARPVSGPWNAGPYEN